MGIYSGINAKIKAMKGHLLKYDDYFLLAQCKTVDEFGRKLLENQVYSKAMMGIDPENIRRWDIEQKILISLAQDFSRIYSFVSDYNLRNFLEAVFIQNEIYILKLLLCAVNDEREVAYTLVELTTLLGKKIKIDAGSLVNSKSINEFISNLKGTVFYNVLSKNYAEGSPSLFDLEMELDLYYYMNLWRLLNKHLSDENKKAMDQIFGTEIDLINLQWIFRLKTYYNMDYTKIYTYLIPANYRLSKDVISRIVEAKSLTELKQEVEKTVYAKDFAEGIPVERSFDIAMHRAYHSAERYYPNSLATTTAFIYYKQLELKNITSILEGIRYGLPQDEILRYVITNENNRSSGKGG